MPGGYSETSAPMAATSSYRPRLSRGKIRSAPPASRDTTGLPAFSAPVTAQESMPSAMPDTTSAPLEASSMANRSARWQLRTLGFRMPTMPMAASSSKRKGFPLRYSTTGGTAISRRRWG